MKNPHLRTYVVMAFVATMVAVLAPEAGTWLGIGRGGAAPAPAAAPPSGGAAPQPFDYFPDHYRNQATEPAEPIDTF